MSGPALDCLRLFDFTNSGEVSMGDLKKAADLLQTTVMDPTNDPANDPALHWDPNRQKRGLGKYLYKANHIAIIVSDVGRSARFYSDIMGFQQLRRPNFDKHGAWFTMGNVELHLIKGKPLVHSGDDLIVSHISIETFEIGRVPGMLKKLGVPFRQNVSVPKGEDGGMDGTNTSNKNDKIVRQYFFRDPDGYYLEVCNCHLLTSYCLGEDADLEGYDESVKPLSLENAALSIHLMQKWAAMGRSSVQHRHSALDEVKKTDGSIAAIVGILGCTPAASVDDILWENYKERRSVYGDICQNESDESLKEILILTGNVGEHAETTMHLKAAYSGARVFQPPAFYEEGEVLTKPAPFMVPYSD